MQPLSGIGYVRPGPAQRGFSMLESLIAVVLLSVALLGLAGLQASGTRTNYNAYLKSQASMIAHDMFERIRANPEADYTIALGAGVPVDAADCEGAGQNCDSIMMAGYDLAFFKCVTGRHAADDLCLNRNYPGLLPDGDGSIAVDAGDYTLTIQWFDSVVGANQVFIFTATI